MGHKATGMSEKWKSRSISRVSQSFPSIPPLLFQVDPMSRPILRQAAANLFAGWDVPALLDQQAKLRPDHPYLVWEPFETEPGQWTYAEFSEATKRIAAGMAQRGIEKGDFVLLHLENCPEFLLSWFACARLGAVAVTTNTRSAAAELTYFAENSGIKAAITQPKFASLVSENCPNIQWLAVTKNDAGNEPLVQVPAEQAFDGLYADGEPPVRVADPTAPLCVMYTSGTTSRPKGVVWSHANGLWAARGSAFHEGLMQTDVHLTVLPLFHMNAMSNQVLASLWVGCTLVLQPKFSASRFWDVALRHRCTWGSVVPFCINALRKQEVPDHQFRVWGVGINGAYDKKFNLRSLGWWGMTETVTVGIVGSVLHDDTPFTLGRPSPLYEIAIIAPDGTGVAPGEAGELRIKGVPSISLFDHYLNNVEATESSFDDEGFFITGDRVRANEDGTMSFQDRLKDMLKVGGENVSAAEVERVIQILDGVAEVAVVAKPDQMLNEVPVAFVLPEGEHDTVVLTEAIVKACKQSLADFKQPKEIRIVDALPRATLDKIAKAQLRDQIAKEVKAAR